MITTFNDETSLRESPCAFFDIPDVEWTSSESDIGETLPRSKFPLHKIFQTCSWDSLDCRRWPNLPVDADGSITVGHRVKTANRPKRIVQLKKSQITMATKRHAFGT
ncbi:hypothetical protein PILCRDRAFT_606653 [Piloderma croceum F 1598]|uniref:Uncharacterized protein n=1 Tax=Piloderma croceum (strain F 1598) TaxID=765440 RepID=A0A0C3FDJ3_PILCF|nr:hypothetical protein PILCRDRAFT_606653 [Piloderma croceum F 1598]